MYKTNVFGIVRAPVDKVWNVFRPFGKEILTWWHIYDSVCLEPPCRDEVGAVRTFVISSDHTRFREELVLRDDCQHVEMYRLLSIEPMRTPIFNSQTIIRMSPCGELTQVEFTCTYDCPSAEISKGITHRQAGAYRAAITGLDRHFHPAIGRMHVCLLQATGLPDTSLLCEGIQECNAEMGQDQVLGTVQVALSELSPKKRNMHLDIQGKGELEVELSLSLNEGEQITDSTRIELNDSQTAILQLQDDLINLVKSFIAEDGSQYEWSIMPRLESVPDLELELLPGFATRPRAEHALSPSKISRILERFFEVFFSQAGLAARYPLYEDKWLPFLTGYLEPSRRFIEHWQEDEEFARSFIQGPNPMLIEVCRSMAQVPADMLGLRGQDHSLHELIAEQRLYVVDYRALKDIPLHEDKVFYAPIVLLYRELLPYGCSRLMPLGIQLTRNPGRNEVYTPHSPPNRYLFAKIHVGSADNQLHQFNTHLSLTHLLGEAFCVGVHNNLSGHPLGTLLLPHTLDTIGINYIARHSLISQVHPLTDATFSVGTVGGLTLVVDHFRAYRFLEWSFPAELARRGFDERRTDGIADFLYRDDGFLLWRALEAYTCKYVNRLYKTDADVAEDYVLQEFASVLADPSRGNVRGFPNPICTKALLTECLTSIIFTCSVQHSAVDYPQWEFYSYVVPRPEQLRKSMPDGDKDISWEFITSALPDIGVSLFQILFSHLLTMPTLTPLSKLNAIGNIFPDINNELHYRFAEISAYIKSRNIAIAARGGMPYSYLDPETVPCSVDI